MRSTITFQEYQLSRIVRTLNGNTERNVVEPQQIAPTNNRPEFTEINTNVNTIRDEIINLRQENNDLKQQILRQEQQQLANQRNIGNYEYLQRIINSSESTLNQIFDYDERVEICNNVIRMIEQYINGSNDRSFINASNVLRSEWLNKRNEYQRINNSLIQNLDNQLLQKARNASGNHHSLSVIDEIQIIDRELYKEDNKKYIMHTYNVRMVGAILGRSIYKFQISVAGFINMNNDSIVILERVSIDE
jgi:hypothetical protein